MDGATRTIVRNDALLERVLLTRFDSPEAEDEASARMNAFAKAFMMEEVDAGGITGGDTH